MLDLAAAGNFENGATAASFDAPAGTEKVMKSVQMEIRRIKSIEDCLK